MEEASTLESLQNLHGELLSLVELPEDQRLPHLVPDVQPALEAVHTRLEALLDKTPRRQASRDAVLSGKVKLEDTEWEVNRIFQEIALQVADEIDLDEIDATKLVLESEGDQTLLGRSRKECAIIRFHRERQYVLDCIRLLLELSQDDRDTDGGEAEADELVGFSSAFGFYVDTKILGIGGPNMPPYPREKRLVSRSLSAVRDVQIWLQRLSDEVAGAAFLGRAGQPEFIETTEFTRYSLIQQHELLAVILCYSVERRAADVQAFTDFLQMIKKADKYDYALVHLFPVLGAFVTLFGSTEGSGDVQQARRLHEAVCRQPEDEPNEPKTLTYLHAAIRVWWLAEYSGWYMDGQARSSLPNVDVDEEDKQRVKQFTDSLKDGAFDFFLALAADVKSPEWQDPARVAMRHWLQRKAPSLSADPQVVFFSNFFQTCLLRQMETFIDASISNLPDILRKLRADEDEQRQSSQVQEQDLNLERFLLIIAFVYEGRPDAADAFWSDPESNLAGFLQWASRRASTPLVSAFCEMLQSLSEDAESATAAHLFLLDEGHHAPGKMRRSLSLTWAQILKELEFFADKIRGKPDANQFNTYRPGRGNNEPVETEPESAMMLECYLRLITKLAFHSDTARSYLLEVPRFGLVKLLFQLISSPVPSRLRASSFNALGALLTQKTQQLDYDVWEALESCLTGYFIAPSTNLGRTATSSSHPPPSFYMELLFEEMSPRFEESNAFVQFVNTLSILPDGYAPLNDILPFPEDLGASTRVRPGIEPYVDYILGHIFSIRIAEAQDTSQQRILRLSCLEFALTCLSTFNEDLIIFDNETNIVVDKAIATTDLKVYATLHPFARVMEWMLDSRFTKALVDTIHQHAAEMGMASPDSPLILSVLRGVEILSKALHLQATYLDLIRPIVNSQAPQNSRSIFIPTSNAAYGSIEDGALTQLALVVDLGTYCGLGHPDLTLASLKLLEQISTSSRLISAWQAGSDRPSQRNKAIVALEDQGTADAVAGSLSTELSTTLDFKKEADSPNYRCKIHILDFLHSCLQANKDQPSIAHLLLGFQCGVDTVSVEAGSDFDTGSSLFHTLVGVFLEMPVNDNEGSMRQWLIALKYKVLRILQMLWTSPLSASLVLDELRGNDFFFHLLLQRLVVQPVTLLWDGLEPVGPDFLISSPAQGYFEYLSMRKMAFEYMIQELCTVARLQDRPMKRRIFEALSGQIKIEGADVVTVPAIFEFHDALPEAEQFATPPPELAVYEDIDLQACMVKDGNSNIIFDVGKVQEFLLLKRNEIRLNGVVVTRQTLAPVEQEEERIVTYAIYLNRFRQVKACSLEILQSWSRLLLVMTDSNDFQGTNKVSFLLQSLQAILPSLEKYGTTNADAAADLARCAKLLLFELDFSSVSSSGQQARDIGSLVSDKLYQLFLVCLEAVARWAGQPDLRSIYYCICYRYISALVGHGQRFLSGRQTTIKTVQSFGDKVLNVVCDDAFGGDTICQTAALLLLGALVNLGSHEDDPYVIEALNKLNFIGVLVDSLRYVLDEWVEVNKTGNSDQRHYQDARLALLLQLCQTRDGAKYVLQSNLFRAIELSGLFSADPELQVDPTDTRALELHYSLLVKAARLIGAAVVSRGSHNLTQGRRFLTEHRLLVMHVLKRSAGIGVSSGVAHKALDEQVAELAEALMVMIAATGFLEFESVAPKVEMRPAPVLFH